MATGPSKDNWTHLIDEFRLTLRGYRDGHVLVSHDGQSDELSKEVNKSWCCAYDTMLRLRRKQLLTLIEVDIHDPSFPSFVSRPRTEDREKVQ